MKIKFLMAEEIRAEISNKASVIGLYPDDVVTLIGERPANVPEDLPEGIERLAFLINVSEVPETLHKFRATIITPSGDPYGPELSFGEEIIKKGRSHTLVTQFKPFVVKSRGIFHFNFYVDDLLNSIPFEIRRHSD